MSALKTDERWQYGARFRPQGPIGIVNPDDAEYLQAHQRATVFRRAIKTAYISLVPCPLCTVEGGWELAP